MRIKFSRLQLQRIIGLIITAIFALLCLRPELPQWLNRIEYMLYDLRFNIVLEMQSRTADIDEKTEHNIVIIDIDESSLAQEGHWPWSRLRLADLINALKDAGTAVVTFDVVFSEAARNPVDEIRTRIPDAANTIPAEWASLVDADKFFAESFSGIDVVLGFFFLDQADLKNGVLPQPLMAIGSDYQNLVVIEKPGYTGNLSVLQDGVAGGFVTTFTDTDGVVRRTPLLISNGEYLYPSLSLATVMSYLMSNDIALDTVTIGKIQALTHLQVTDKRIRTDAQGRVIVPYRGGAKSFTYYSAKDVLNGTLPSGSLEGAIALVGTSALGLADLRTMPLQTQYPGVEVHANVVDGLLNGHFPYRPDWEAGATASIVIIVGVLLALLLPVLGPLGVIACSAMTLLILISSNYYFWAALHLDLPLAISLLMSVALSTLAFIQGFLFENASRRQLRGMFDQYVPPAHIERMMSDPNAYQFEGESKELTVLFSDIRSFTTISEQLSAADLKRMLNEYFTPITKVIFDNDGTIDKYVGDMVMAFWGAPLDDPKHAAKALRAALAMQRETARLREEFQQRGLPPIHIGIGLNTGFMNVGDMGSSYRRAYTVLGDAVNLGSRLESITKFYGVGILISETTRNQAPDFICRYVDCIIVKGKEEPVKVFEVLGEAHEIDDATLVEIAQQGIATAAYMEGDWDKAERLYHELKQIRDCKLYDVYLHRISVLREQQQQGLLPEWNGVYRHTEK